MEEERIWVVFILVSGFLPLPERNMKGMGLLTVIETKENRQCSHVAQSR